MNLDHLATWPDDRTASVTPQPSVALVFLDQHIKGSADLFLAAREHLAWAVCGVGFFANIPDICCKNRLAAHPNPSATNPQ